MTKSKVSHGVSDKAIVMEEKRQALSSNVMPIDSQIFLITTCDPLQLTLQCPLTSESQNQLGLKLQGQLNILQSRGFIPTIIFTDLTKGFTGLVGAFPGVMLDPSGAEDHVAKVEA